MSAESCRFEGWLDVGAERLHRLLRFVERHVADRNLQHDVIGEAGVEDVAEAVADPLGRARPGLDGIVDVGEDPAQWSERGVGACFSEHLDVPSMYAVRT